MARRAKTGGAAQAKNRPATVTELLDKELAASALRKRREGQQPNREELGALRRIERERAEAQRWQVLHEIPKRIYLEMAGRSYKTINDQARLYRLPLIGKTIDLVAVIGRFHDFLAENKHRLAQDRKGRTAKDEYWEAKSQRERLAFETELREWVRREHVSDSYAVIAGILRSAQRKLQQRFGPDAHLILDNALADAERRIRHLLGTEERADAS